MSSTNKHAFFQTNHQSASTMSSTTTQTLTPPAEGVLRLQSTSQEVMYRNTNAGPLQYSGSLDQYKFEDMTPVIGREFKDLQLADMLTAPNSDAMLKDLAILVSRRGVCFFRDQQLTGAQMTAIGSKLGQLSGKPAASTLHVHPLTEDTPELGSAVVAEISSEKQKKGGGLRHAYEDKSKYATTGWHSDITFEPCPSDYAMLKIHTLPETGGDTLWGSAYEAYDRLSAPMRQFMEGLTATHDANFFHDEAKRLGIPIKAHGRGNPLNEGEDLRAVHPVIRTNPVTGWKGLFVNYAFTKRINDVSKDENDFIMKYCHDILFQNHDLQVRFKWTKNAVAIWDNRSTFHCATYDYNEARSGDRVCSVGEKPYLDPASVSRMESLKAEGKRW